MVHLGRFAWPHSEMNYQEKVNFCKNVAEQAYSSSGLLAATKASKKFSGYITIEDTPGNYNYNPKTKLCKAVFYENNPHTRYGYHAKYQITETGLIEL
jgi:hypothetical protein